MPRHHHATDELTADPAPDTHETASVKTCLTKRGYTVVKDSIPAAIYQQLKGKLTVQPFIANNYGATPSQFKIYLESASKIYMPKHFGLNEFGDPQHTKLKLGSPIEVRFQGDLRPKQLPVVGSFLRTCRFYDKDGALLPRQFHETPCGGVDFSSVQIPAAPKKKFNKLYPSHSNGGLITVGCGFGKTVMALWIAAALGRKTLVIVHKDFLVKQWRERIQQYLPKARIGCIQGCVKDVEDKDIVIGMLQSVSMKDYPDAIFSDFGFTIIDECHHIAAEVFSRSLHKINTTYMLGLSATPHRKDGLSKVFEWFLGPYVFIQKEKETRRVDVHCIRYYNPSLQYSKECFTCTGKLSMPKMINQVCYWVNRTELVVRLVLDVVNSNPLRQVLLLTDRRKHIQDICASLHNHGCTSVGFYLGGMKQEALSEAETKRVILATYSMSSEGMDIPSLNTLILASPKTDVQQSVGRILRKHHDDACPTIYDVIDDFSVFRSQGNRRLQYYKKNNFTVDMAEVIDKRVDVTATKSSPVEGQEYLDDLYKKTKERKAIAT